jgi:hypothetical protein
MRRTMIFTFLSSLALAAPAAADSGQRQDSTPMTAREEIDQNYDLAPNSTVRVEGVAGPVTVETGDFSRAELHVVRMAASQRELDCYRTHVSATRTSLTVEHVQGRSRECRNIRSRQEVRLRLPRSMSVEMESIAGAVEIGAVDGMVRLNSIAGRTALTEVRSAEISSIAGPLILGLAPLGREGIEVSSVAGPIELSAGPGVDADVEVDSIMGSVSGFADLEGENGGYRARIGRGGGRVSLSSIVGSVRLRRP